MKNLGTKMVVVVAMIGAVGLACMDTEAGDPTLLIQRQAISDCGGFGEAAASPAGDPETDGADDYCAAELLEWTYDAATETLELTDARALLNCCGERTMELSVVDDVYVVTETDAPVGEGGRCDCVCVFDLRLTVEGLVQGVIPVRIERFETDVAAEPSAIWNGEIDLGLDAGDAVIDGTEAGPWCHEG